MEKVTIQNNKTGIFTSYLNKNTEMEHQQAETEAIFLERLIPRVIVT